MSLKDEILFELEANRDKDLSGQFLAEKFGVSRNAVWKSINSLKKDGYIVDSSTNKGYKLSKDCDILSESELKKLCDDNICIYVLQSVDSTNNEAKRIICNQNEDNILIASDEQTIGRGRKGRDFYSPKGTGVYFSVVISPKTELVSSVGITSYAAACVVKSIKKLTNLDAEIKWVNDIYLNGKKICGILTEAISDFESGTVSNIIIGIGINLKKCCLPTELKDKVGFLNYDKPIKNLLVADIASRLTKYNKNNGDYIEVCKKRSMVLGKEITYIKNNQEFYGKAIDIDKNGGLIVLSDGKTEILNSGEISLTVK